MDKREALLYSVTWEPIPNGSQTVIPGLGLVTIYKAKGGYAVDINLQCAWSAWRGSLEQVQRDVAKYIRDWLYLNCFVVQ